MKLEIKINQAKDKQRSNLKYPEATPWNEEKRAQENC